MPDIVAISPNGAGTWRTGVAVGALDGILPETVTPIAIQGNRVPIESIGISDVEFMKVTSLDANPTLTFLMRWNGMWWSFLTHWMGDDTKTGAGPIYVHALNYQRRSSLVSITMAIRIDSNNSKILEWPSLKPQQIVMGPNSEGFMEMQVVCMGNSILQNVDATSGSTEFGNVTYATKAQELCIRGNLFRLNSGAGALTSTADDLDVEDFTLTLDRPLVADRPTEGSTATGGAQVQIPEPVQDGATVITAGWNEPDFIDIDSLVDDYKDNTTHKADLIMNETIGGNAHVLDIELGLMEYMNPEAGLDRQARVPIQREFRCITPQSTPTGHTTANPIHVEIDNTDNLDYEIGA